LWEHSYHLGPDLEIGEVYSFKNLRIRAANNGTYEGKMQEQKISKLDPAIVSTNSGLKALLEWVFCFRRKTNDDCIIPFFSFSRRKAAWADKYDVDEPLEKLNYTKVEDIRMRERFNCLVEVRPRVVMLT
jgi:hypothetical protein